MLPSPFILNYKLGLANYTIGQKSIILIVGLVTDDLKNLVVNQISLQLKKTILIKSPISVSCRTTFWEKHQVLRCKPLIRVWKSGFLRSICQVFSLPMNSFRAGRRHRYAPHSSHNHCFTRMPALFNRRLAKAGHYDLRGEVTANLLTVSAPNMQRVVKPKGEEIRGTINYVVFLPKSKEVEAASAGLESFGAVGMQKKP